MHNIVCPAIVFRDAILSRKFWKLMKLYRSQHWHRYAHIRGFIKF